MRQLERPSFFSQAAATLAGAAITLSACGREPRRPGEFIAVEEEDPGLIPPAPPAPTAPSPVPVAPAIPSAPPVIPVPQNAGEGCDELKRENTTLRFQNRDLAIQLRAVREQLQNVQAMCAQDYKSGVYHPTVN